MGWHKVSISVADAANGKHIELQNAFERMFEAALAPEDAAMFGSKAVMENDYFFSPGAVRIARPIIAAYRGAPCDAPKRSEVRAIVTNHGARGVVFAD